MAKCKTEHLAIFAVAAVFLLSFFAVGTEPTITGDAVSVRYYGVSNYPLNSQAGKIQTKVTISQPELGRLANADTVISVASSITNAADFANGVVSLFQGNPPLPIPTGGLDLVISASKAATDYFKSDTQCLRQIGSTYGSQKEVTFVIVSRLYYAQCSQYTDWNYAAIEHKYYTMDGKYLCTQTGKKLFSMMMTSAEKGKISKSTYGC